MPEIIISTNAPESVEAESTLSFDVLYTTQDPVDDTLSGLQLYLHFDSSELSLPNGSVNEALNNLLLTPSERLVQLVDTDPNNNIPDIPSNADDGNAETDAAIQVNYVPGAQNFPNQDTSPAGGGVTLYSVTFDTTGEFDGTTLEFTQPDSITFDSETSTFYELESDPVEIDLASPADTTPPEVEIVGEPETITTLDPFNITFEFSEVVTGFELSDITVNNGSASNFNAVDEDTYTADITPTEEGEVAIAVAAGVATDEAGNANLVSETTTVTVDTTIPEENQPPTLDPIILEGTEDQDVIFTPGDFTSAFDDEDDDNLQSIKVVTLPTAGTLTFNGEEVNQGDDILAGQLGNLRYSPAEDATGVVTFGVTASDGTDSSEETTVTVNLTGEDINNPPNFDLIENPNQVSLPGEPVTVPNFATNISPGEAEEADQNLDFIVEIQGRDIFAVDPTIDDTGTLTYTLADDVVGASPIRVTLMDDGGTENGGDDTSETQTFVIRTDVSSFVRANTNASENSRVNRLVFDTTDEVLGDSEIVADLSEGVQDLGTEAEFANLVGLYEVVDENGGIDTDGDGVADVLPTDQANYARAAIENRVPNFQIFAGASGDEQFNTTPEEFEDVLLSGGKFYAPFVIANGAGIGQDEINDFQEFINREEAEDDGVFNDAADFREDLVAYFAFGEANPDNVEHLFNFGNGVFGFEDLPGGGDLDFNDAVFELSFAA
jgi:hypothetical protein